MSTIEQIVNQIGIQAKAASKELARISGAKKKASNIDHLKQIWANQF